jgi:hypothetical protein
MIICGVSGLKPGRTIAILVILSTRRYRYSSNAKAKKKVLIREHGWESVTKEKDASYGR